MTGLDGSTWPEMARAAGSGATLLVPVGSTEQHGPHLPLTTDTDIAVAIATAAASRCPELVVAPALAYGSSGEHEDFAGTLSIGRQVTETVLVELGRSASRDFTTTLVVSTHGGNAHPLGRAMARLVDEGHPVVAWWPDWPGDLHAGRTETSLMLAIAPGRVHLDRVEVGDLRPAAAVWPELVARGVRTVSSNGVLGDPAGASAEEGRALLGRAADSLLRAARRARADRAGGAA
ncbi:MAG: mycofactocin biosynthesis peptidyl-dipeptidase MftE [Acidimicrobiales bacterium]